MRKGGRYIVDKAGAAPRRAEGEEAVARLPSAPARPETGEAAAKPAGGARGSKKEN